jgi:hypothetical protein
MHPRAQGAVALRDADKRRFDGLVGVGRYVILRVAQLSFRR